MQYSVTHFEYQFAEDWEQDVFEQSLADIGYEVIDGTDAYIQTALLTEEVQAAVQELADETKGVRILATELCEDKNWNETWEAEQGELHLPMDVTIVPHCAFGAGHHETTGMLIDSILQKDMRGLRVLDNGCGTGVLGIMAAKCGAKSVVAVDIDDKSVDSTRENAERNDVKIDARLGSEPAAGEYDLILSNIHRNILLEQMDKYAQYLAPGGELWISGFYKEDVPQLTKAAEAAGLKPISEEQRGEWVCMKYREVKGKR